MMIIRSPDKSKIIQYLDPILGQPGIFALSLMGELGTLIHDPPGEFGVGGIAVRDAAMTMDGTKLERNKKCHEQRVG